MTSELVNEIWELLQVSVTDAVAVLSVPSTDVNLLMPPPHTQTAGAGYLSCYCIPETGFVMESAMERGERIVNDKLVGTKRVDCPWHTDNNLLVEVRKSSEVLTRLLKVINQ